jgi:uncharacterized protein YbjQ (UPF0145 family)
MIVTTTEHIPDRAVTQILGIARGSSIRAKHLGKDLITALRSIVGGELKEYGELIVETRKQSLERMQLQAERMGADAVVNVRFETSQVMAGAAELLAYGTAVKLQLTNDMPGALVRD